MRAASRSNKLVLLSSAPHFTLELRIAPELSEPIGTNGHGANLHRLPISHDAAQAPGCLIFNDVKQHSRPYVGHGLFRPVLLLCVAQKPRISSQGQQLGLDGNGECQFRVARRASLGGRAYF